MFLNKIAALDSSSETAVEIELWEGYLTRDHSALGKTLCIYSLDNGPLQGLEPETIVFRFLAFDWLKNIRQMLDNKSIHYSLIAETNIDAMRQLRKKIYVADDDSDTLFELTAMLEEAGYHVRASHSGKPIMEAAYACVDLFVLERRMPDIDGLDLCRYLRSQPATKHTPVIVISALPKAGNEALDAGANDYIEKPFQMQYLLHVISKYIRQKA